MRARPRRPGIAGPRTRVPVQLTVENVRGGEGFPIVAFREIPDRDTAEAFRDHLLEVPVSELPLLDDDEYYPFDLEGLEARDVRGEPVGRVTDIVESPAHAILVITLAAGGELMVPFVRAAVPIVSLAEGFMVVEPGFLSRGETAP